MSLGTIKGQIILDVKQALASYTSLRGEHVSTVTALQTGAGALAAASAIVMTAGLGMAGGFVYAATKAGEFERKLDYFSAVSNSTQAEYEAIKQKALDLGASTIYSADQIAESFVELGKAGVNASDIVGGIGEAVANLSAAADIPLDQSAQILMAAVQTWKMSADEAIGVADKLAGAANASIIDVDDLGTSLKYVGGVAASLGIPFEDANTAIALLGTYGIKGSMAGTSLRQMMISLTGKTKKAVGVMTDLGIITEDGSNKFFNADGSAKSLAEVFQVLQDATSGLTQEQRLNAFQGIFQSRALAAAAALTREGAAGFEEMAAAIDKTTALDVASERLDNLSGDLEILRSNIDTLVITTGDKFQGFARKLVQGVTDIIQKFVALPDSVSNGILIFAGVSSVLLIIIGAFGLFAAAILNIIALALRLGPAFGLLKAGLLAVRGAIVAMSSSFLATPLGWILIGVIALVAAFIYLWNNCEGFRNFWTGLWESIKSIASAVWNWLLGLPAWFAELWNSVKETSIAVWDSVILYFSELPGKIAAFFIQLYEDTVAFWVELGTAVSLAVGTFIDSVVAWFEALPERISTFMAALPERIGYFLGLVIGTFIRWVAETTLLIIAWGTNVYETFITWLSKLPGQAVNFFTQTYTNINTWLSNASVAAAKWVVKIFNDVVDWFKKLPGKAMEFFTDVAAKVSSGLIKASIWAKEKSQAIYDSVVDWFKKLPGKVLEFVMSVATNVSNGLSQALSSAKTIASNIYNGVVDGIKGLPDQAKQIFNNVVQAVKDKITAAFNAVKEFAAGLWRGFKDGLGIHSPSYIEHAMWAITDVLDEETQRMARQVGDLQYLGNNISEMGENLGFGFTDKMASEIGILANQVEAVKQMETELSSLGHTVPNYGQMSPPEQAKLSQTLAIDSLLSQMAAKSQEKPGNTIVTQHNTVSMPPEVAKDARRFFGWLEDVGMTSRQVGTNE